MSIAEILQELENLADPKRKQNLIKLGIPKENSLGVSTGDIRALAKKIKKDDTLALALWQTNIHDAKLLAVLLFNPKNATDELINQLMLEIHSWDLCDHFCKNYLLKTGNYQSYIDLWVNDSRLYYKRASFTLIAAQSIKEKGFDEAILEKYFNYIERYSDDDRVHVYKAISWALREIGKQNLNNQERVIICAHNLLESDNPNKQRIAKLSLPELTSLVEVAGRRRLISDKSKMAKDL